MVIETDRLIIRDIELPDGEAFIHMALDGSLKDTKDEWLIADQLYIKVMPSDPKTIPFYEKFGFQQYENYSAMLIKNFWW